MTKKTTLFLFAIAFIINAHAQTITKQMLTTKQFAINGEPMFLFTLDFFSSNGYVMDMGVEGIPWRDSGKYQIINNAVYLHCLKSDSADRIPSGSDHDLTLGNCVGTISTNETGLYYTQFLDIKLLTKKNSWLYSDDDRSVSFPVPGSEVPAGSKRMIKSIEVFTTGLRGGITTDNVRIRDQPSRNGKSLTYLTDHYGGDELPSVPKGTELITIARTTVKEKIDKYEDYWYYVKVGAEDGVWMYGAFIKFQ